MLLHPQLDDPLDQSQGHRLAKGKLEVAPRPGVSGDGHLDGRVAAPLLKSADLPVEVEYENGVVSQFPVTAAEVTPSGVLLHLGTKHTACLAQDRCGVGAADAACCTTPGCY
ncbi:MAG TPA: DUF6428 family protein [Urbifossiella sp.]|nr:DUF6428 family protein [Urbifossiella sp.]